MIDTETRAEQVDLIEPYTQAMINIIETNRDRELSQDAKLAIWAAVMTYLENYEANPEEDRTGQPWPSWEESSEIQNRLEWILKELG